MSEPFWEPLAASPAGSGLPPVVNGQWLKGVGGAAVWAPLAIVNADVAAGAAIDGSKINPVFPAAVSAPGGWFDAATYGPTFHAVLGLDPGALATSGNSIASFWYDSTNNVAKLEAITGGVAWRDIWACLRGGSFKVGTQGWRVHRHPYATDRHIESGTATIAGGGQVVVSFNAAFSSPPNVVVTELNGTPTPASIGAPTTTAVQIFATLVGASVFWIAEGPN